MKKICVLMSLCFLLPLSANAENKTPADNGQEALLQSYEANRLGWTFDDNDVGYMDFTLSLMYPIFLSLKKAEVAKAEENNPGFLTKYLRPIPYLAFTGRFGQYLATRKSSPVIGKRFNPKLFLRFFTSKTVNSYLDLGFAHESNGQRIDSLTAYQDLRDDFVSEDEDSDFANDYISRGWDYWEVAWYKNFNGIEDDSENGFSTHLSLKYFMEYGYLQKDAEEYNSWENSSYGKPRKEVDGITVRFSYKRPLRDMFKLFDTVPIGFGGQNIIFTTGYNNAFTNNTLRGECWIRIGSLPILLWVSEGYNSDLIDYYQRVRSSGFCLYLKTY
ncbi:MAG: hypothetical protein KAV87_62145 [Desulfobacteraceae bacterium]|nr:hypothetical protein [Desulfobacteraceae bacterium]